MNNAVKTNSIEQTHDTNIPADNYYIYACGRKRTNLVPSRYPFVALTTTHRKLYHQILALVWGTSVLVYSLLLYSISILYPLCFPLVLFFVQYNAISEVIKFEHIVLLVALRTSTTVVG
jgi:hypothetical protein